MLLQKNQPASASSSLYVNARHSLSFHVNVVLSAFLHKGILPNGTVDVVCQGQHPEKPHVKTVVDHDL